MGLGSEIRDPEKNYSGSRIQGSKRHRIPDPDPQHCIHVNNISVPSGDTVPLTALQGVGPALPGSCHKLAPGCASLAAEKRSWRPGALGGSPGQTVEGGQDAAEAVLH